MINLDRITAVRQYLIGNSRSFVTPGAYKDTKGWLTGDVGGIAVVMFGIADGHELLWTESKKGMRLDGVCPKDLTLPFSLDDAAMAILGLPDRAALESLTRAQALQNLRSITKAAQATLL